MRPFEVELRGDCHPEDDAYAHDGQLITRSQTAANPLSTALIDDRSTTRKSMHDRILACGKIQRQLRQYNKAKARQKRGIFVPIEKFAIGEADWCIVFDKGQDGNRRALAKCLLARGLDVIQSVASGDDSGDPGRRKVFMRIRARGKALREEAEQIGLMCELDPGRLVWNGREKTAVELSTTGKPRLYGRGEIKPVSIIKDTEEASYGYYRYSCKRDHFFVKPLQNNTCRFNTGDRQVLVKSLIERAMNDYYCTQLQAHRGRDSSEFHDFHEMLHRSHLKGQPVALEDLCELRFCKDVFPERSPDELESLRKWASWKQLKFWKTDAAIGDLVYVPLDALVSTTPVLQSDAACHADFQICLYVH